MKIPKHACWAGTAALALMMMSSPATAQRAGGDEKPRAERQAGGDTSTPEKRSTDRAAKTGRGAEVERADQGRAAERKPADPARGGGARPGRGAGQETPAAGGVRGRFTDDQLMQKLANAERAHLVRMAKLKRLRQLAAEKGDTARLVEIDRLSAKETARRERQVAKARRLLGADYDNMNQRMRKGAAERRNRRGLSGKEGSVDPRRGRGAERSTERDGERGVERGVERGAGGAERGTDRSGNRGNR